MWTLPEAAVRINPRNLGARTSRRPEPFCSVEKWLAEFLDPAEKGRGRVVPSPGRAWWPPLRGIEEDPGGPRNVRDSLVKFR